MTRRPHRRPVTTDTQAQKWAADTLVRMTLTGFETPHLSDEEDRRCRATYPLLRDQLDEWSWSHHVYGGDPPRTRAEYIAKCRADMAESVRRSEDRMAAAIADKGPLPHGATRELIQRKREASK